ncbi:alkaline phosphatase D family protein [Actinosynnema sp. NPDC047251]|uniref:Alkaline phosphatase D n=1 Tax=Saccharothrix espanaensis (strain ATCC 51144 / DSM 44229 / JCM 9112 / NBRC 15066 / NRRL 15764) TaxID=1179773 RepID=K0KEB2_SACES|nr:alkaline phosphatase D family protein [Saccharothrix espanaensis]CCH35084.1 Alkaline phosphatase D [Saccharothrix espanaensis DSM 44229]
MTSLTRRTLLIGGAAAGAVLATTGAGSPRLDNPFTLGVASGDPSHDGLVLWTRLAPKPLTEDGLGGMPNRVVPVHWELAEDERFRRVVRRGVEIARPQSGHSVHVEPFGLRPGREYFYRFRVDGHVSPTGRTRTAPEPWSIGQDLTMCFVSCAHYGEGYFTAYRRLAEDDPGLVLHLGDYQYEYAAKAADVRTVVGPETRTLADYRLRHALYKTDPDLQLAHAVAPWAVVWDDHEIENNWADEVPEQPDPDFLQRRAAAFQAYYENMPLRRGARPNGVDLQLYRRLRWGNLATFHLLDTRQYRDDQACGDGWKTCAEAGTPTRTITGAEQERWLLDGFRRSRSRWDVLGQQVFFAERDRKEGPDKELSMDSWDGYLASRDRITRGWVDARVRNTVVLTGDVHAAYAADVKADWNDPASRTVGTELVCSSVTSGGDGNDTVDEVQLRLNPHIKLHSRRRGYVRTRFSARQLRADFRALPHVRTPGAQATTLKSFVVEDRNPGLNPV